MHDTSRRTPARRGIAAAVSGVLVSGAIAGTVIGGAGAASAAEVPVTHKFATICKVKVGSLNLGKHNIKAKLTTAVDVPLMPGQQQPEHEVSVQLTMPKTLQKATTDVLGITHAKGSSPDSAVDVTLPLAAEIGGGEVTNRIPLEGLSAPKAKVPRRGAWRITSTGTVPAVDIPGFAGRPAEDPDPMAAFALAPRFTIKATLFAKNGKKFPSTMSCKVSPSHLLINDQVPIGPQVAATLPVHKGVGYGKQAPVQLVFFHPATATVPADGNTWTEPEHGTLTPGAQGLFTYTPDEGYAGPDSFDYTAKDDSNPAGSTSTVTLKVKKAPSTLGYKAPKRIRFGKAAEVKVKVTSQGERSGPITITKGSRDLAKGKVIDGRAMLTIKRKALKVGEHTLKIRYAGSDTARHANAKLTLRVLKKR